MRKETSRIGFHLISKLQLILLSWNAQQLTQSSGFGLANRKSSMGWVSFKKEKCNLFRLPRPSMSWSNPREAVTLRIYSSDPGSSRLAYATCRRHFPMMKLDASLPPWQLQRVPTFLVFDKTNWMHAAICVPVTEPPAPAELQRCYFYLAGPALAQMKRHPGIKWSHPWGLMGCWRLNGLKKEFLFGNFK